MKYLLISFASGKGSSLDAPIEFDAMIMAISIIADINVKDLIMTPIQPYNPFKSPTIYYTAAVFSPNLLI
jgi:hypothetical protein